MSQSNNAGDMLFTIATALGAVVLCLVFIAAGSAVAKATFSPHTAQHSATPGEPH